MSYVAVGLPGKTDSQPGLHHNSYGNGRYKELSGQNSRVRGGELVNLEDDWVARIEVVRNWGIPGSRSPLITW